MKLDKRILTGKKYLDCFDTDIATEFVSEKCYFGKDVTDFEDISKLTCTMLYSVDNSSAPYDYYEEGILHSTGFILPCAWVKEPEKRYRPYTLDEWIELHEIGEMIHFRHKSINMVFHHMYVGYEMRVNAGRIEGTERISIGNANYGLAYLFENYEINIGGEWVPFGIEDEE
jgi:hypothetical protein